MMNKINLKKITAAIKKYNSFLITTHTNPEGDALGSQLSFYRLLRKLNKRAFIVNQDPIPREYSFLCASAHIKQYATVKNISFDCMVVLDCSDLNRTGQVHTLNTDDRPVINIDHHISNNQFGDFNWVEPGLSSASEMVYLIYKNMGVPFDKESALFLYVGIMTDTGSFRYSNTSAFTHKAISELMHFSLDPRVIYKRIYENLSFTDSKFLIKILNGMQREKDGEVIWVEIPARLLRDRKVFFDLSEHILNFIRSIKDVKVVALFKENLGGKREIRFNLRSNSKVDVNKVARSFGGGGHKAAAGCTVRGKLTDIRKKVISAILKSLS